MRKILDGNASVMRPGGDTEYETSLVIALIISDKVLNRLAKILRPDLFSLEASRKIVSWILGYHSAYAKAPGLHVQDLYDEHRKELTLAERELIEGYLSELSSRHVDQAGIIPINDDYALDKAMAYLERQALGASIDKARVLLDRGHVEEARAAFEQGQISAGSIAYRWVAPFDDFQFVTDVFDDSAEILLEFTGKLNSLIGPMRRGFLLGLMAFTKRGKTWYMQEIARQAVGARRRVAWVSLEMESQHFAKRLYHQISAYGEEPGWFKYPVFDCKHNQDDSCGKSERVQSGSVPDHFDERHRQPYRTCCACRDKDKRSFSLAIWWEMRKRPGMTRQSIVKKLRAIQSTQGRDWFRLISYPENSANTLDFRRDLDELERHEDFIPDVIIVDYADILKPERSDLTGRDAINETWMMLKNLASVRKCLVVTVSQTNRDSADKALLKERDTAEDIRKLQHVDVMLGLNQTEREMEDGILRIAVMEHRWRKFNRRRLLAVTQQLELGQPILDEEIMTWRDADESGIVKKGEKKPRRPRRSEG